MMHAVAMAAHRSVGLLQLLAGRQLLRQPRILSLAGRLGASLFSAPADATACAGGRLEQTAGNSPLRTRGRSLRAKASLTSCTARRLLLADRLLAAGSKSRPPATAAARLPAGHGGLGEADGGREEKPLPSCSRLLSGDTLC